MGGRLGPYEILHRIGAGGMAETFVALRRGPGAFEQRVCLKRILPVLERDRAFVEQFLEEARVSARLRHANIVQVLDFGFAEGSHYLALELVEGMDLYRLLALLRRRGESLTSGLVAFLATELGTALEYAHSHPEGAVLHRDISPSNVLLSRAGEVKLSDFGIARAATPRSDGAWKTATGILKGKVPYMAPEYALSGIFEPRSDLFALGVTLYEALAGRRPFVGVTELDTLRRISSGTRPPLAELCPTAPVQLVAAIERLLEPDPSRRFEGAAAFLDALIEVAPPPTARRILGELVRRAAEWDHEVPSAEVVLVEGTAVISDAARSYPDPEPVPAPPDARTRTRIGGDAGPTEVVEMLFALPTMQVHRTSSSEPPPRPATVSSNDALAGPDIAPHEGRIEGAFRPRFSERPSATAPVQPGSRAERASVAPPPSRGTLAALAGVLAVGAVVAGVVAAGVGMAIGWAMRGRGAPQPGDAHLLGSDVMPAGTANPSPVPVAPAEVASEPASDPVAPAEVASEPAPDPVAPVETRLTSAATSLSPTATALPPSDSSPGSVAIDPPVGSERPGTPAERAASERAEPQGGGEVARPAHLRVIVTPWGDVWIDGRYRGRAPRELSLSPGRHVVGVGHGAPAVARTIELGPGERRELELDLLGE